MKKSFIFISILLLFLSCNIGFAEEQPISRDLTASLAQLPGRAESPEKGTYVDIVKAIDDIYPGKINIKVYPMARSINNIIEGKADFHLPSIKNPNIPESKLPFKNVTEKVFSSTLVIYSHQDKIITRKMIEDALEKGGQFPYVIEAISGTENLFRFPVTPSSQSVDPKPSLLKVQNKRIDALMFTQELCDMSVKSLKLNMIHREHYNDFDGVFIVPNGPTGDELDQILSKCLRKLKASGKLQEILKNIYFPYSNWQPHDMGW